MTEPSPTTPLGEAPLPPEFRPIADLDEGWQEPRPGARLADAGGELPNIYCSSPFVRSPLAWGVGPRYTVAPIDVGALSRSLT